MTAPRPDQGQLGRRIALTLRVGTLAAMALIGIGFVAGLAGAGTPAGPTPLTEMIGGGGADALVGIGLLALTLIPGVVLAICAVTLWPLGERRNAIASLVALALLAGSLVIAVVLGAAS